jgi:hypothetical protein
MYLLRMCLEEHSAEFNFISNIAFLPGTSYWNCRFIRIANDTCKTLHLCKNALLHPCDSVSYLKLRRVLRVADGENGLQLRTVAASSLNKQSQTVDSGWPSDIGVMRRAFKSSS